MNVKINDTDETIIVNEPVTLIELIKFMSEHNMLDWKIISEERLEWEEFLKDRPSPNPCIFPIYPQYPTITRPIYPQYLAVLEPIGSTIDLNASIPSH